MKNNMEKIDFTIKDLFTNFYKNYLGQSTNLNEEKTKLEGMRDQIVSKAKQEVDNLKLIKKDNITKTEQLKSKLQKEELRLENQIKLRKQNFENLKVGLNNMKKDISDIDFKIQVQKENQNTRLGMKKDKYVTKLNKLKNKLKSLKIKYKIQSRLDNKHKEINLMLKEEKDICRKDIINYTSKLESITEILEEITSFSFATLPDIKITIHEYKQINKEKLWTFMYDKIVTLKNELNIESKFPSDLINCTHFIRNLSKLNGLNIEINLILHIIEKEILNIFNFLVPCETNLNPFIKIAIKFCHYESLISIKHKLINSTELTQIKSNTEETQEALLKYKNKITVLNAKLKILSKDGNNFSKNEHSLVNNFKIIHSEMENIKKLQTDFLQEINYLESVLIETKQKNLEQILQIELENEELDNKIHKVKSERDNNLIKINDKVEEIKDKIKKKKLNFSSSSKNTKEILKGGKDTSRTKLEDGINKYNPNLKSKINTANNVSNREQTKTPNKNREQTKTPNKKEESRKILVKSLNDFCRSKNPDDSENINSYRQYTMKKQLDYNPLAISTQDLVLIEKLRPLIEGTIIKKRNLLSMGNNIKFNTDYTPIDSNNLCINKPEDYNFRSYFLNLDKKLSKLTFNKINEGDKTSEINIESISKLVVPLITKEVIFIKDLYKKLESKMKLEAIDEYIINNPELITKMYNKGFNLADFIQINKKLFIADYRKLVLQCNIYLLQICIKPDNGTRIELIFNDYSDFKYWINGIQKIIQTEEVREIIKNKII